MPWQEIASQIYVPQSLRSNTSLGLSTIEVCLLLAERQENHEVQKETGFCVIFNIEHSPERYGDICLNPLVWQTELLVL